MGTGVTLGPDGVPRDVNGDPLGERGTSVGPDGSIVGPDGAALDTDAITQSREVAGLEDGPDAPGASVAGGDDDEGLDTASKWGIGVAVAALSAIAIACCVIFAMGRFRDKDTPRAAATGTTGARAAAVGTSSSAAATAAPTSGKFNWAHGEAPNAAAHATLPGAVCANSSAFNQFSDVSLKLNRCKVGAAMPCSVCAVMCFCSLPSCCV